MLSVRDRFNIWMANRSTTSSFDLFDIWRGGAESQAEQVADALAQTQAAPLLPRLQALIDEAVATGQVVTVELVPHPPLAMGRYSMVGAVRQARKAS